MSLAHILNFPVLGRYCRTRLRRRPRSVNELLPFQEFHVSSETVSSTPSVRCSDK